MTLVLSYVVPCLAKEAGKSRASSPAQTTRSPQPGEAQSKLMNQKQKDEHQLNRMMDQRDWDHRKAGRDWKMRGEHEDLGH
ncbi:hypothetical protein [Bradyrhizobium guangxiense]|uniref:hypothetical protein n=1 Tax=Bradyrhizobium guangxiense TaxID=1325115 RepID=UPI0010089FFA|nr:hypothetical protein [Bradyrhizobium guangxiense]